MISQRLRDFLSSFGMMLLGVCLLFFATISLAPERNIYFNHLPTSNKRTAVGEGGDFTPDTFPASLPAAPKAKDKTEFDGQLTAVSAVVIDSKTKDLLYSKNINEVRSLASISKLMTAMVLLDLPVNWSATATIADADYDGSDHHVQVGESFTMEDLWHVALIGSSNTAINAMVRSAGYSTDQFADLMNKKAKELSLLSARFVEPTGLSQKNMANVLDTARLLRDALLYDKIYKTMQMGEYFAHPLGADKPRQIWSTNWLLTDWVPNDYKVEDIVGKTGYITDSRYNFAVSLTGKHKHNIIVVILGAETNEARFTEALTLAKWTFGHYLWPDDEDYKTISD